MTRDATMPQDEAVARRQRDQALASAGLSLAVVAALFVGNFASEPMELRRTEAAVRLHHQLLAQHRELLRVNEDVLKQNQAELQRLRQAAASSSP